jgi:sialic acid synthase SpsE
MKTIKIANRIIGENKPCFIIAEAGINHNGSMELAKKLIDAAVDAKADAIKFQTFIAEEEVTKITPKASYQQESTDTKESYYEMIKKLQFNEQQHIELMKYATEKNIIFLSTPSEEKSAEMLQKLNIPAFKIGSNDIVTIPMLEKIASYLKPMILSRGMATEEEIQEALDSIRNAGNNDIILLHCTSSYPTKSEDLNLQSITKLQKKFNVLIGYSDHSEGIEVPVIATLLGAVVLEKHFTLDKKMPGPDHKFALNPIELIDMIHNIRSIEQLSIADKHDKLKCIKNLHIMLGKGDLKPTKLEIEMRKFTRKSIVARNNIKKGVKICREDLAFKRPASGIPARQYKGIIGRKALLEINKDEFITFENTI